MTAQRKGTVRMGIALAVLAVMATVAIPSYAQGASTSGPLIDVSNPTAGAYLRRGKMFIYGNACDPSAAPGSGVAGTGIRRIAAYLGDRDTLEGVPSWRPGGYMTSASILNNPQPSSELGLPTTSSLCKVANAGFQLLSSSLRKGTWNLNIYVLSMTGKETHIVIPGLRVDKP